MKNNKRLSNKGIIALDVDGCLVPNTWVNKLVGFCEGLAEVLHRSHNNGYGIMLVTGQSYPIISEVRRLISLPYLPALAEHGGMFYENGNVPKYLLSDSVVNEFMNLRQVMVAELTTRFNGVLDPYDFIIVCEITPAIQDEAKEFLLSMDGVHGTCKVLCNPFDARIAVLPEGVSKDNLFKIIDSEQLLVAAGDSGSDLVYLEKARFPIVTFEKGQSWNKKLCALAEERGKFGAYIAQKDEPDGIGLRQGLLRAYELGIL